MSLVTVNLDQLKPEHLAKHIAVYWQVKDSVQLDSAGWAIHPKTGIKMGRSADTQKLAQAILQQQRGGDNPSVSPVAP